MADFRERGRRVCESIGDAEAFVAVNLDDSDGSSLRYLSGFTGEGAIVVTSDGVVLLTDSRYTEQARLEASCDEIVELRRWYTAGLAERLKEDGHRRVAFASSRVSHHWVETVGAAFDGDLVALRDPLAAQRAIKDQEEIDALRTAAAIADRAFAVVVEELRAGMNEVDIALRLELLIRESEADGVAFGINVSSGPNTALNHYLPTLGRRTLAEGDLVLFDFGACAAGYRSDMTRTVCVGTADTRAKEIYGIVLEAQRIGIEGTRAGADGVDVDRVVRETIAAAGYGDRFGHGLGHGIGLDIHEKPALSQQSEDRLEPGMVVTVEPGIYIPGYGGVRIEDDVLVTADGNEVLTDFPKDELIEVGS
ncbi:MAG: aminopeptidase P family protein [Candidatus Bipolaricaulota bacterium]|nr:MAG: aminopeptidase P family protein [Candidatus Bipolaricaulota bacterium]